MMDLFTAFGLSASAGLNAYIPLMVVALIARFTDLIVLHSPWDALTSWFVIGTLGVLISVEFFADKIPGLNHLNDLIQTFVRPVAGSIVFLASTAGVAEVHPVLAFCAGLLVAGGIHALKSIAVRPAVSAATAGAGHPAVSTLEDGVATVLSILAIVLPVLVGIFFLYLLYALARRAFWSPR
jgi:hypothetical protein